MRISSGFKRYSASAQSSDWPRVSDVMAKPRIGKIAVFIHSTSTCVSAGSWVRTLAISPWTRCSATCMSVPHSKWPESSVEPRDVVERIFRIPGTRSTASSSGRVTVVIM